MKESLGQSKTKLTVESIAGIARDIADFLFRCCEHTVVDDDELSAWYDQFFREWICMEMRHLGLVKGDSITLELAEK